MPFINYINIAWRRAAIKKSDVTQSCYPHQMLGQMIGKMSAQVKASRLLSMLPFSCPFDLPHWHCNSHVSDETASDYESRAEKSHSATGGDLCSVERISSLLVTSPELSGHVAHVSVMPCGMLISVDPAAKLAH